MKTYNKPPLCFIGNKKNLIKPFNDLMMMLRMQNVINDQTIFYDVFGKGKAKS